MHLRQPANPSWQTHRNQERQCLARPSFGGTQDVPAHQGVREHGPLHGGGVGEPRSSQARLGVPGQGQAIELACAGPRGGILGSRRQCQGVGAGLGGVGVQQALQLGNLLPFQSAALALPGMVLALGFTSHGAYAKSLT